MRLCWWQWCVCVCARRYTLALSYFYTATNALVVIEQWEKLCSDLLCADSVYTSMYVYYACAAGLI